MAEFTIAAGFARGLLELAVSKGATRKLLLDRSRIRPDDLQDQDGRIPMANYLELMEAGVELCDDPALALHFGEAFTLSELSIVGLICESAETGMEAFEQMNRYSRLMVDAEGTASGDWFEIRRREGQVWFELVSSLYVDHPRLTESAFARVKCGSVRYLSDRPFARAVHFTQEEPGYRAEFDRIFEVPVVFGSDRNALLIDESSLSVKMRYSVRYVFGILSEHADALLRNLESSRTVRGRVESLLIPILHKGEPRMEAIARNMGLSRQTLYRRLKAEGVSYGRLLDELRHRMALHYLNGKKVSVNEAAYLVGFSEPSAFSRAFKRWTGTPPSEIKSRG